MKEFKEYKGYIMAFGLFRIRKDLAFYQKTQSPPYLLNMDYIKRIEPILQKFCIIKWLPTDINDPEISYH